MLLKMIAGLIKNLYDILGSSFIYIGPIRHANYEPCIWIVILKSQYMMVNTSERVATKSVINVCVWCENSAS